MLWVKKGKVSQLYPLFAAENPESGDIRKFENLGTRSFAIEQAIGHAIDFHEMIGVKRKLARLNYLKKYWAERVGHLPGVSIGTSLDPAYSGTIALLKMEGKAPASVANELFKKAKIHTVGITWGNIKGVRITPNVYTRAADLDRLVATVETIASKR
jgi:selenocysteine lyase/cysteine desulfurase